MSKETGDKEMSRVLERGIRKYLGVLETSGAPEAPGVRETSGIARYLDVPGVPNISRIFGELQPMDVPVIKEIDVLGITGVPGVAEFTDALRAPGECQLVSVLELLYTTVVSEEPDVLRVSAVAKSSELPGASEAEVSETSGIAAVTEVVVVLKLLDIPELSDISELMEMANVTIPGCFDISGVIGRVGVLELLDVPLTSREAAASGISGVRKVMEISGV